MNKALAHRAPRPENATRFWWIRHARVPSVADRMYGNQDLDCDTSDATLFKGVAARLPCEAIWVTSQLRRTHQTADALLAAGAPPPAQRLQDAAIAEMDFGVYNGMSHAELRQARADDPFIGFWPMSPHDRAPDGESFTILRDRVGGFIDGAVQAWPGRDIVCPAHRGTILAALQIALDLPLTSAVASTVDNVSLTRLTHHADALPGGPRWRVEECNWLPRH